MPPIGRTSDLIPVNAEIGRIVSSRSSVTDAYEKIAALVGETIQYDRIAITVLDFEQNKFRNAFVLGTALSGIEQGGVFTLKNSFASEVAKSRRAIGLNPLVQYPYQDRFLRSGLLSRMATPLISNDEVIGTLHLATAKPNAYVEQDLATLENVGNQIAGIVHSSALVQAEQGFAGQLEAFYSVADILAQPQTFEAKVLAIVETLVRIANADHAIVRRSDENGNNLNPVAAAVPGVIHFEPNLSVSDLHSASARAFREERMLLINDYQTSPDAKPAIQAQGVASGLVMPIKFSGRCVGVLSVTSKAANHFDNERVTLLTAFSNEIGLVFDTADLTDRLQASQEEMATVDEIARIVTSTLEVEDVYDRFADEAKKHLDIDRITIGVFNHEAGSISVKYSFSPGISGLVVGDVIPLEGSSSQAILADGLPIFRDDISNDLRNSVDVKYLSLGLRSCAQVLLNFQGRSIGIIGLWSQRVGAYGPKEQATIGRLANQIAPAVENAELYADRIQAQEDLRSSVVRARAVLETAADGIITINERGIIESFNPAAESIFDYPVDEVVGRNVSLLMPDLDRGASGACISRYLGTGEFQFIGTGREVEGQRKDGTMFPMELSIGAVEIGGNKIFTGIIRDITERKATEVRLSESRRLASVGEPAAGVAHEINNPLTAVILASDFLIELGLSCETSANVKLISDSARRAARIVQNLLLFCRNTVPEPEYMTIELIAQQALELKTHDFKLNKIKSRKDVEMGLPRCFIDRHQICQVIINVLNNAQEALMEHQGGGNITIDIRSTSDFVVLEVRDDGPGIDPEVMPTIFEPFFTTKPVGAGIGLGLSICYGIIQQHGGEMWADNNAGAGASIFIQLPIAKREFISQSEAPQVEETTDLSMSQVLIVDDERAIRDLITTGLRGEIRIIHQATDGEAALEMLRDLDYDCILLDLRMPGISGMEVFEKIVSSSPSLADRIIFMTGDTASQESAAFDQHSCLTNQTA